MRPTKRIYRLTHEAHGTREFEYSPGQIQLELERGELSGGVIGQFKLSRVTFYLQERSFIEKIFDQYGIQAIVHLDMIQVSQGRETIIQSWELDFRGLTIQYDELNCSIKPKGLTTEFLNQMDIEYPISFDHLPYTLQGLDYTYKAIGNPGGTDLYSLSMANGIINGDTITLEATVPQKWSKSDMEYLNDVDFSDIPDQWSPIYDSPYPKTVTVGCLVAGELDIWAYTTGPMADIIRTDIPVTVQLKANGSIIGTTTINKWQWQETIPRPTEVPDASGYHHKYTAEFKNKAFESIAIQGQLQITIAIIQPHFGNYAVYHTSTPPRTGIKFRMQGRLDDGGIAPGEVLNNPSIAMRYTPSGASTPVKKIYVYELFKQLIKHITGLEDAFQSDYFDLQNLDSFARVTMITNGKAIRQFPDEENTMYLSFKWLFEQLEAIYNIGYKIYDQDGDWKIRIEPKSYFYKEMPESIHLQNVDPTDITISVDAGSYYNQLSVGFQKNSGSKGKIISDTWDFSPYAEYNTPLKKVKRKFSKISQLIISTPVIEDIRHQPYQDNPEKSTSYDDKLFLLMFQLYNGNAYERGIAYADQDKVIKTINAPQHTNAQILLRHWEMISGAFANESRPVEYVKSKGTSYIITKNFDSRIGVQQAYIGQHLHIYGNHNTPVLQPIKIKIKSKLSLSQYFQILQNPEGLMTVSEASGTKHFYMHKATIDSQTLEIRIEGYLKGGSTKLKRANITITKVEAPVENVARIWYSLPLEWENSEVYFEVQNKTKDIKNSPVQAHVASVNGHRIFDSAIEFDPNDLLVIKHWTSGIKPGVDNPISQAHGINRIGDFPDSEPKYFETKI